MRAYESETAERAYTPTNLELSAGADGTALAGAGCVQCADQQVRRLGSMRAGEASSASATFDGTLVITAPSGKQMEVRTTFDTGSDTDAVSVRMATKLIELGCSWGDAGGGIVMADGRETTPHGELRLMLSAEPKRKGQQDANNAFALPRSLTFVTDAQIIDNLTSELIIGWPTLKGTGLLAVVLGLEQYEPEEDHDDDGLDDMWDDDPDPEYGMPRVHGADPKEVEKVKDLCQRWKHLFGPPPKGGSKLPPIDIELKKDGQGADIRPKRQACRPAAPWIQQLIEEDTAKRIELGWYRKPEPNEILPYASPIVAAKQPSKGPDARRICVDYRAVNDCAEETRHPVKNQQEVLRRLKGKKRFGIVDLRKGYHQVKLTKRASILLAVVTHKGIVIPVTAPFGFHGLPAQFQYYISEMVLGELDGNGVEAFIDDLNINADSFEEFIQLLEEVFVRLDKYDLRVNGPKTHLNLPSCEYLGRWIDGEGRQHKETRLAGIAKLQRPYDRHQTKSLMSLVNYFREHCGMDFADKTQSINKLLKKDAQFIWTDEQQRAFESIVQSIMENQKLYWLDYEKKIYFRCDASKIGCGAQLFQHSESGNELPIAYISHTFTPAEQNWSTLEQELFAAVWAVKQWMSMLEGAHFTILTDHKNILQLQRSLAPKVVRWRLAMQQFDYEIVHVSGTDSKHAVADCLSRLHGPAKGGTLSTAAMTRSRAKLDGAMSVVASESEQELLQEGGGNFCGSRSSMRLRALEAAKEHSKRHNLEARTIMTTASAAIDSAGPAIDRMDPEPSRLVKDGTDLRNKRRREGDLEVSAAETTEPLAKHAKRSNLQAVAVHLASSPTKRKRDPLKEINGKETSTTVARTVKVGRQNFTHCKLCNDSFPTAKCDDNPKLNKQFCATCWALKKPECEAILSPQARPIEDKDKSCVLCGKQYKPSLNNCPCCAACWRENRQDCIEAEAESQRFHERFNLERSMKAMQAETEEPQEETEETEETEEPTDQDHGERAHRSGASGKKTVYVSPQTRAIFDTYHNATVGHMGRERTRLRIEEAADAGVIMNRKHIPTPKQLDWLILHCKYCQKIRLRKRDVDVARASLMTKGPFDECSLDVIGPLPPDVNGNKFIIVMIDNFSHFVFAEPAKSTEAESAAKFIIKISAQFGLPKAFRWDNCPQFEGHLVRCLLALIGADRHPSVPYNPQTNGVVERVIQEIMRHLRFICNEVRIQTEWEVYLPLVLRILNSEPVATIGLSPVQILLPGIDLQAGLFPTAITRAAKASINAIPEKARREAIQKWITHLQDLQIQAIKTAGKRAAVVRRKIAEKAPLITRKFKEGDYVITQWRAGRPHKLSVLYQGPYEVVKQLSNSTYRVRDPADGAEKEKHISELYQYYLTEGEDTRDTIAMDDFEQLVEAVVDHRREPGSTSLRDLEFRLRWLGKPPAEDTWVEYAEVTRKGGLSAFWDYVKAHPELKIKVKT